MARSILGTIGLAATLVFAAPIALAGAHMLVGGDHVMGGALVSVAVLMVVLQEHLTTPGDIPAKAAQRVVGGVVGGGDESDDE